MTIDPKQLVELNEISLCELVQWTERAMARLRTAKQVDDTGTIKRQFNYWKHCRSAYKWAISHNSVERWQSVINKWEQQNKQPTTVSSTSDKEGLSKRISTRRDRFPFVEVDTDEEQ